MSAEVEYRIVRNRVVRDVERGKTLKTDVCDAHPELLRAARNVGRPTKEVCPICDEGRLVTVTFVFGAKLPAGGRCPGTVAELKTLCRRPEPVLCYEVEVCPDCTWHHLMKKYPAGGPKVPARRNAASWREKFIRSARLICFFVISMPLKPFFSFISMCSRERLSSSLRARTAVSAATTPLISSPFESVAVYLKSSMESLPCGLGQPT